MSKNRHTSRNIDWITILIYMILVFLGWMNIYAAVYRENTEIFDISHRYGMQLLWIVTAFAIGFAILLIESNFFSIFAFHTYFATVILLILVIFVGKEVKGARAWFAIGEFKLQPSELSKFATALALSKLMGAFSYHFEKREDMMKALAVIALPVICIFGQNDTGSALVYGSFMLVLFREGMPAQVLGFSILAIVLFICSLLVNMQILLPAIFVIALIIEWFSSRSLKDMIYAVAIPGSITCLMLLSNRFLHTSISLHLMFFIGIVVVCVTGLLAGLNSRVKKSPFVIIVLLASVLYCYSVDYIFDNVLEPHQRTRINVLLGVEQDLKGAGYNVHQSMIAIGSGGWTGKGFLQSTQTKYNFVPEQSTDFIFCTLGEEWGFVGSFVVIGLFVTLLLRILYLAERQRSNFSRIYGYSVASIIFFHLAVNLGMTMGLIPVIGIPLPFFSYGGSSLWAFTVLLFIFIRLDASRLELV